MKIKLIIAATVSMYCCANEELNELKNKNFWANFQRKMDRKYSNLKMPRLHYIPGFRQILPSITQIPLTAPLDNQDCSTPFSNPLPVKDKTKIVRDFFAVCDQDLFTDSKNLSQKNSPFINTLAYQAAKTLDIADIFTNMPINLSRKNSLFIAEVTQAFEKHTLKVAYFNTPAYRAIETAGITSISLATLYTALLSNTARTTNSCFKNPHIAKAFKCAAVPAIGLSALHSVISCLADRFVKKHYKPDPLSPVEDIIKEFYPNTVDAYPELKKLHFKSSAD